MKRFLNAGLFKPGTSTKKRKARATAASDDVVPFYPTVKMACKTPAFLSQRVLTQAGVTKLGDGCFIVVSRNVLDAPALSQFVGGASTVKRRSGFSLGHRKPRAEVCYSETGEPYMYSGQQHRTVPFPPHALSLSKLAWTATAGALAAAGRPPPAETQLCTGVDIQYSPAQERGGSMGAHADDEDSRWGLVLIYSLGQTRWLRVRRNLGDRTFVNVRLEHNSVVAMYGARFQTLFAHQVDKLSSKEPVGSRLSLNLRYRKPDLQDPADVSTSLHASGTGNA